ncbi:1-phosphatidylinositol phosphodiesterase [Pseudomonas sp. BS3782 TE3695]|jgi:1-phosphatidylinositol phosphodiesterase|uniref:phospholipase n=1 Tax=Pseudomonas sp. BS3782 TE3695 TaxID=3349323 RepID=UPI003D1D3130
MNTSNLNNYENHNWMAATPAIDTLSLRELTLPGTHNTGCDREASYALFPGPNYLACQDVPFFSQLSRGSRALDIRLVYDADASGLGKFRFQHGDYLSSRTLEDLVSEIKAFLVRSHDEFIVLAFHELKGGKETFDFKYFNEMMLRHLGDQIIPAANQYLSLGQLKKISPLQRVLVAAPRHYDLDYTIFCKKIEHKWVNQNLVNTDDLQNYIATVMNNPPDQRELWSLSATCYSIGGPKRILEYLDLWFDPAKSKWAETCNIINFDFIKDSRIVSYCRTANLNKAAKKI